MRQAAAILALLLAVVLCQGADVAAVEFVILGARAAGMGGAGVAVTTDALATYWNPAGLAMERTFDIRGQVGAQVTDRLGVANTLQDINNLNRNDTSAANQARLQALVDQLAQPAASLSASGAAGLYFKGYAGDHYFGMNVSDVATGGAFFPVVDRTVTVSGGQITNNSQYAMRALEARQIAFSYAYAFADRTLSIGATVKAIQGAAYSTRRSVIGANGDLGFNSDLGKATLTTGYGIDVGVVYRPASWLQFGVVGKDLNGPTFDVPGGGQAFQLNPQFRAGMALKPYESLTLAVDGDLNKNSTLVPQIKSRVISVGAEQTFFERALALRAGVLKNVEDANSYFTPTAGLGARIGGFTLDLGGGYDFRQRGALGSFTAGFTF